MKTIKTALYLLLTSFVLFSCAKEDDAIQIPTQQFSYNNVDYDISRAVITENGSEKSIIFFSGGLDLNAAKDSIIGFGSAVYIDLYCSDLIGEFTYNSSSSQVLNTYDDFGYSITLSNDYVQLTYEGDLEEAYL